MADLNAGYLGDDERRELAAVKTLFESIEGKTIIIDVTPDEVLD